MTGQFRPIVRDNHLRPSAQVDQAAEFASNPDPRQGDIDNRRQGFAREVVDHAQRPEPRAIAEGI